MTHESAPDFSWQENKAFADLICTGFKTEEIEALEGTLAKAEYDADINKCLNTLHSVVDQMLEQGACPIALIAAMKQTAEQLSDCFGKDGDSDA